MRAVGRYEIRRELGRGGMATVYLAYQPELQREVALKELRLAGAREDVRRFLREARLASSLVHPSIVTVHDYFEWEGTPYIAMEYLPRGALRKHIGRLTLAQVGGVLQALLAGLAYAGSRGIVHRDLKPENLMVSDQGRVKIADFGIAKASASTTASLTTAGTTLGTPRYMAPERALGQDVGPSSDLYSAGIIAFELLVGRTPFHETVEPMAVLLRQINDPVPPVSSLVPDVGEPLSRWVGRLLEKAPEDRTPSAAAAWDELEEVLIAQLGPRWARTAALAENPSEPRGRRDAPPPPPPPTPPPPPSAASLEEALTVAPAAVHAPRRRRRWRVRPASVLAVLAAVVTTVLGAQRLLGNAHVPLRDLGSRADLASGDAGDRAAAAEALAGDYEAAAKKATGAAGARLRRVARAYRRAADAARREDGSDYDDALKSARAAERHTGADDEASDDASDDEGEN